MNRNLVIMMFVVFVSSLMLVQCSPAPTVEVIAPSATTKPTQEPSAVPVEPEPTAVPPTATVEPTQVPTEIPLPTEIPTSTPQVEVTYHWSSHASTGSELSFENPGEWIGPAVLPFGEGLYVKDADQDIGVIMQYNLSGNPDEMIKQWAIEGVNIPGLLVFVPESASEAEPVTISRVTGASQVAVSGGLTARAVYIKRPNDVMLVMWYAPTEKWETMQETFDRILTTIEIWRKYTAPNGLHTMYLHDWQSPVAPMEDDGVWFRTFDEESGLDIQISAVADPKQLLNDWTTDTLEWIEEVECTVEDGEQVEALGGTWDTKTGNCVDANGVSVTYVVTFVANRDRVVDILYYAPVDTWDYSSGIFFTMLGLLTDVR